MGDSIQYSFQRYEVKYFLTPEQAAQLVRGIAPYTRPDAYGRYTIRSIYYDTPDWRLIRASLAKPDYKEKLRVRSYGTCPPDGQVFVELKKKCAGIVYKRRITAAVQDAEPFLQGNIAPAHYGQIGQEIAWFQTRYHAEPKVLLSYDRAAFAGTQDAALRMTLDQNIRWRTDALDLRQNGGEQPLLDTDAVLLEIKLPGVCPLWLSRLLSELGARPASFSKYGAWYRAQVRKQNREGIYCA